MLEHGTACTFEAGVHRKPSRDGQLRPGLLSETVGLCSGLVGPMQKNMAGSFIPKVCDGAFLPMEEPANPGFGGSLKHCLLFTSRDPRTSFSGEASR